MMVFIEEQISRQSIVSLQVVILKKEVYFFFLRFHGNRISYTFLLVFVTLSFLTHLRNLCP